MRLSYFRLSFRRWLGWLALALTFAVACWFLSQWQFARRAQVVAVISQLEKNYSQPPVTFSAAIENNPQVWKWRQMRFQGEYLTNKSLLVRNRALNGNPGFEQLVAFRTYSGEVVFVDRGWLPTGSRQDIPDVNPLPVCKNCEVIGRVMPSEPRNGRTAPSGQIATVNSYQAAHLLKLGSDSTVRSFYVTLSQENPKSKISPVLIAKPQLDEGNHLSYAFQWLVFALMGFAALAWAIRKEFEEYRLANDPNFKPKSKRISASKKDEQVEDSLIGN